jgi:hypothetical protein
MIEYTFVSAYSYLNQQSTITDPLVWFGLWCLTALSTIFQLYHGGGNRSNRENHRPVARHKLYHILVMLYRVHFSWTGFELTTLVVIGTHCIGNYKSNYHTILIHWKLKLTQFWNLKTKFFRLLIEISLYFLPQNHFLTIISL